LADKAEAESVEGLLKITIPKAPLAKAKSIKIKPSK
jgi:HSP20 family molecular chaperone IbpA